LTGVHHSIEKLAVTIKRQLNIPIIVGGPHPTYSPEMIFGDGIDIICQGEGELALLELADALEHDRDVTKIRNLHVKTRNGTVHRNDLRPAVPLDELPFPDRELYYKYPFLRDMPMKRFISSMGCPYPCTFCHEPVIRDLYKKNTQSEYVRRKSVARAVAEIKYIKDQRPLSTETRALLRRPVLYSEQLRLARRICRAISRGSWASLELQHSLRLSQSARC
jgi:radical SAM superfamily enzyme YgiQ (UPF0313 family)